MDLPVGEKLGKAFEADYPGISVQIERSGSERLFQRIDQEFASNIRAVDVDQHVGRLAFHPLEEEGLAGAVRAGRRRKHSARKLSRSRRHVRADRAIYLSSIAYNTNLVKPEDAPKSFADLLDPEMGGQDGQGPSRL